MSEPASNEHLEPESVAAYVTGRLPEHERVRVERHLAGCSECVSEIVAIHRIRQPRQRSGPWLVGGVAAAAALVIWVGVGRRGPQAPPDDIRGPGEPSVLQLDAVRPADGSTLDDSGFVWHALADAVAYRLTITDAAGDEIWNRTTSDTTLRRPTEAGLAPGRTYFWYVDALRSDGVSATSGVRRFHVGE